MAARWITQKIATHRKLAALGLLLLAVALVLHGILGPQFAPKNFATLFVWVHYRGLLVIGLLVLGNVFCASCPIMLVRNSARRLIAPKRNWPQFIKNKWLATSLFVAILFWYEASDLWAKPFATALLIVLFFALALAVDLVFKNASFCKYVCPIGQFNFVASLLSPTQVGVKKSDVCATCTSLACIKGTTKKRGCELKIFVPKKAGGFDCTLCMDCADACPHENVVIDSIFPGLPLVAAETEDVLSGLGQVWRRHDVQALIVAFTFGALLNAFAMVGPAYETQSLIAQSIGTRSELITLAILFFIFLIAIPLSLFLIGSLTTRRYHTAPARLIVPGLIPLGVGIWASHYSFHFFTGALTFVPLLSSLLPMTDFAPRSWAGFPMGISDTAVRPLQMGILSVGLLGSIITIFKRAQMIAKPLAAIPWVLMIIGLAAFAGWIFSLPMEMRGTVLGG